MITSAATTPQPLPTLIVVDEEGKRVFGMEEVLSDLSWKLYARSVHKVVALFAAVVICTRDLFVTPMAGNFLITAIVLWLFFV